MKFSESQQKGFTLIELLVVISIISLLSSVVLSSLSSARNKAKIATTKAELNQLRNAISALGIDTGLFPTKESVMVCGSNPEAFLNVCSAGISCTDGNFPGWGGPYMSAVPKDPWGNDYYFDGDYQCNGQPGCESYTVGTWTMAIDSFGPNGVEEYGGDDVALVICSY